jgi:hypothetical protein
VNGQDSILDREYAQQLQQEKLEQELARREALPKQLVLTDEGPRMMPVLREPVNHPLPNVWPQNHAQRAASGPHGHEIFKGMSGHQYFQKIPLSMMYTREVIEKIIHERDHGSKTSVGLSDFQSERVKMSFK